MTELERLVDAVVTQWRADGGIDGGPIAVSALLDRVLPYRVARRMLGIDVSEDYEALVLRMLSEEEDLVCVTPTDAAELAKVTANSRLPDLGVLQLLRSASFTVTDRAIRQVPGALPASSKKDEYTEVPELKAAVEPAPAPESQHQPEPVTAVVPASVAAAPRCWSCAEALPPDRPVKFCPFCGADQRHPVCGACGAHAERAWKHCPDCGAAL